MRNFYTAICTCIVSTFLFSGQVAAHVPDGGDNETLPITLYLSAASIEANLVDISYEINYPGFLEFHLFDNDGKQIFLTSMVKNKGKHAMRLKKHKLISSETYSYYFIYKGKEYHGSFTV